MRVHAVSDIHTDYKENLAWVEALGGAAAAGGRSLQDDVLLVAGDVSDDPATFERTLGLLASTFGHVCFTPGNHDLWTRRTERRQYDSLGKLQRVHDTCKRLGVHTAPVCLNGVWLVPLLSWYHASWDREPDVPGAVPIAKVMMDFHACTWESVAGLQADAGDSLARHFDGLNEPALATAEAAIEAAALAADGIRPPVISFSHFLPLQQLLPEKRMLYFPNLAKAVGSNFLAARVTELHPDVHVFGHTHFSWDAEVGGVRYVQWPLCYPQEQKQRRNGGAGWLPLVLWDSEAGGFQEPRSCFWSQFYANHPRNNGNVSKYN